MYITMVVHPQHRRTLDRMATNHKRAHIVVFRILRNGQAAKCFPAVFRNPFFNLKYAVVRSRQIDNLRIIVIQYDAAGIIGFPFLFIVRSLGKPAACCADFMILPLFAVPGSIMIAMVALTDQPRIYDNRSTRAVFSDIPHPGAHTGLGRIIHFIRLLRFDRKIIPIKNFFPACFKERIIMIAEVIYRVGCFFQRMPVGKSHMNPIPAVVAIFNIGSSVFIGLFRHDQNATGLPILSAVTGNRDTRLEIDAAPKQIELVALIAQLTGIAVTIIASPVAVVNGVAVQHERTRGFPGANVLRIFRNAHPHRCIHGAVFGIKNQQSAVAAHKQRGIGMIVGLQFFMYHSGVDAAADMIVGGHYDIALMIDPTTIGFFI